MHDVFYSKKTKPFRKYVSGFVAFVFSVSLITFPASNAQAQYISSLPAPGTMVLPSTAFEPPLLKGMTLHPENPLAFDFIVDRGQDKLSGQALKDETTKLLKYFLTAMTIPEDDSWVNLSPYEKDRIIPDMLATTDMGKAMLEQDYLLKQLSASLTSPETELGKKFWDKVYKLTYEKFGTTQVPINTFNKVWIVPDSATILEQQGYVFVGNTHLKVMMDQDYQSIKENLRSEKFGTDQTSPDKVEELSTVSARVVKEIIIPELEKEINGGKNFASVRQMYSSVILAAWYKQNLKNSLLGKVYVDRKKTGGVNISEKDVKQKVYEQYLEAFRKGVYSLIKEDFDLSVNQNLPRKYFSGGLKFEVDMSRVNRASSPAAIAAIRNDVRQKTEDGRYVSSAVRMTEGSGEVNAIASRLNSTASSSASADKTILEKTIAENRKYLSTLNLKDDTYDYWKFLYLAYLRKVHPGAYELWRNENEKFFKGRAQPPIPVFGAGGNIKFDADFENGLTINGVKLKVDPQEFMRPEYREAAKEVEVVLADLNAGFGLNLARLKDVEQRIADGQIPDRPRDEKSGEPIPGAKSMDLFIKVQVNDDTSAYMSVFELRLLRAVKLALSGTFKKISIQELVNEQSVDIVQNYFQKTNFPDVALDLLGLDPAQQAAIRGKGFATYGELLKALDVDILNPEVFNSLPNVNANGEIIKGKTGNAGHGLVAYRKLYQLMTAGKQMLADQRAGKEVQPDQRVYAFMNGDGPNNWVPQELVGWLSQRGIGMAVIGLPREMVDIKVGAAYAQKFTDGDRSVEFLGAAEIAEVKGKDRPPEGLRAFLQAGRTPKTAGKQWANTNTVLINGKMAMFLAELAEIAGDDVLAMAMMPTLILSNKEGVYNLEGTMLTTVFNTFNFVNTSTDPRIKVLLEKYGFNREHPLLALPDIGRGLRDENFTPVKFIGDWIGLETLLSSTEKYGAVDKDLKIKFKRTPGLVNLDSDGNYARLHGIPSYSDLKEARELLGNRGDWSQMDTFTVFGRAKLPNATLVGNVQIENQLMDTFDVEAWVKSIAKLALGQVPYQGISLTPSGRVKLENVTIIHRVDGKVKVFPFNAGWAEKSELSRRMYSALERIYKDNPVVLDLKDPEAIQVLSQQIGFQLLDQNASEAERNKMLKAALEELGFQDYSVTKNVDGVNKPVIVSAFLIDNGSGQKTPANSLEIFEAISKASSALLDSEEIETSDNASTPVVLVVEDNLDDYLLIESGLRSFDIIHVENAADARQVLANPANKIDVLLTDNDYPENANSGVSRGEGEKLLTELPSLRPGLPGVLMSGADFIGKPLPAGARGFLDKNKDLFNAAKKIVEFVPEVASSVVTDRPFQKYSTEGLTIPGSDLMIGINPAELSEKERQLINDTIPYLQEYAETQLAQVRGIVFTSAENSSGGLEKSHILVNLKQVPEDIQSPLMVLAIILHEAEHLKVFGEERFLKARTFETNLGNVLAMRHHWNKVNPTPTTLLNELQAYLKSAQVFVEHFRRLSVSPAKENLKVLSIIHSTWMPLSREAIELLRDQKAALSPEAQQWREEVIQGWADFDQVINALMEEYAQDLAQLSTPAELIIDEGEEESSPGASTSAATSAVASAPTTQNVGGIDFDPKLLNLQIKRDGKGVPLPLPQQNLERINLDGLYPVILNMQPATIQSFPFLMSSTDEKKIPELSMAR